MTEILAWDRCALEVTETIVGQVKPEHLDRPTPCARWSLRRLLAHMIGQNYGFAAAAEGELTDHSSWADRDFGADPAPAFRASAARVIEAFAGVGVADHEIWLPEVRGGQMFPAPVAIGFHFVDYVVHGWDVAASIGVAAPFGEDILQAVLPYAEEVPDGPNRRQPGASFQPALRSASASDHTLDRILAMLGRSPAWPG